MQTVFSHIIQKRFSQVNEDVATDALTFVLESSETARNGMMKFLRGIVPNLPPLRFKTQQTDGSIRPDMWGYSDTETHLFVENKFWAGLTDNQPVSYLKQLSVYTQPTVLLVIGPAAREQTLRQELNRRLLDAGIPVSQSEIAAGVTYSVATQLGPILALTSWSNVLSVLEHEAVDDPGVRGDLVQLRALCNAADIDAFTPISSAETSDQRTPAFMLQLSSLVQAAVDYAVTKNILNVNGLRPQASWDRIGRYVRVSKDITGGPGLWFGVHFGLWKTHGATPLWLIFSDSDFGRAHEVRPLIEPWAAKNGLLAVSIGNDVALALEIPSGEEKSSIIRSIADKIGSIAAVLAGLPSKPSPNAGQE